MSWLITGTQKVDPDAAAYIAAVEVADGQALETGVKDAITAFVLGCKADGIWNAIKASCILAGARTLAGALVPLVGAAPTNSNFVAGDYNRKTGLLGNGSTKYLNSNRNNNADPQNSKHIAAYVAEQFDPSASNNQIYIGTQWDVLGGFVIGRSSGSARLYYAFGNSATAFVAAAAVAPTGLFGVNRSASSSFMVRAANATNTTNIASTAPTNENISIFRGGTGSVYSGSRIAFYSIGEALNLALLDARVTALVNALAVAIP
jgi:hypothetical protein